MITHLLFDIEGTTCPTTFVSDVLFPYAYQHLEEFIDNHVNEHETQSIIKELWEEWKIDNDSISRRLYSETRKNEIDAMQQTCKYLKHLITIDRKSSALKDLQGRIWAEGYKEGSIKANLYPETCSVLKQLHQQGQTLAVYSSGSIPAQKLLYGHTAEGDLTGLFRYWFDTHSGNKKESSSYRSIATSMQISPQEICFISDSGDECDAASEAGMATVFSLREGNPDQNPRGHQIIESLTELSEWVGSGRL